MQFSLLKTTDEFEVEYNNQTYLLKIIKNEQTSTDSVLIYENGGELINDKLTEEIYDQFCMEN